MSLSSTSEAEGSSSKPTTRWSTCEAASSAAMSAAAVPMSIRGLAFALESGRERTPPRASRRPRETARDATFERRDALPGKIFCVATDAPVASSATPRSPTVASEGTSTAYVAPRYATRTHFLHPPRSGARASRYACATRTSRVQPAYSARARFSSRGDPSRRARGCRWRCVRTPPHSRRARSRHGVDVRDDRAIRARVVRVAVRPVARARAPRRRRARLASSASLVPKGGDILARPTPSARAPPRAPRHHASRLASSRRVSRRDAPTPDSREPLEDLTRPGADPPGRCRHGGRPVVEPPSPTSKPPTARG